MAKRRAAPQNLPRVNPPDGHLQHWTRPIDALLLAGAWLLEPVLGFRQGLYLVAVLSSPLALRYVLDLGEKLAQHEIRVREIIKDGDEDAEYL